MQHIGRTIDPGIGFDDFPESIVLFDQDGTIQYLNKQALQQFGYSSDELVGAHVERLFPAGFGDGREPPQHVHALGEQNSATREVVAVHRDGSTLPIEVTLGRFEIDAGQFILALFRDVSDQERIRELLHQRTTHLHLLQLTNNLVNDTLDIEDAFELAIRKICEYFGFAVGHGFASGAGASEYALSLPRTWYLSDAERFGTFARKSDKYSFRPGTGFPGLVMESGDPIWAPDVTSSPEYLRQELAVEAGLHTGIFIPVLMQSTVTAVLEFYSTDRYDEDSEVLDALSQVGVLLGRVIERRQALDQYQADAASQRVANSLMSGQHDVLTAIACGMSLPDVARRLATHVETHIPGAVMAMFTNNDADKLEFLTGPSIPVELVGALARVDSDDLTDPTVRAAISDQPVTVVYEDGYRPASQSWQIRAGTPDIHAVWCYPVRSSANQVLGVTVLYAAQPRIPTQTEREVIERAVGLAQIAMERDLYERQLALHAFYDDLTGLPKRALLMDRIHHAQQRAVRSGTDLAVLFVDLDQFKSINDSLGHHAGDELLRITAARLASSIRADDTLVRFAGDEFVIVLEDITSDGEIDLVVERIQRAFLEPLTVIGSEVYISCSIGIVRQSGGEGDPSDLLRRADHAMYRAKAQGRGTSATFCAELDEAEPSQFELESQLRRAVTEEEFSLVYQPVFDLRTGNVFAIEALLRWHDDELGTIPPDTFLPIAEKLGLMPQITRWVFLTASSQIAQWRGAYGHDLRLMINITGSELLSQDVLEMIQQSAENAVIPADRLILELTEEAIIETYKDAAEMLQSLRQMKIEIALDDFGTGYSSLAYLHQLPVSYIKLDKTFLTGPDSSNASPDVLSGIVQIAQKLGFRVIAEGVEEPAHEQFVRKLGCDLAQGCYFAPPQTAFDTASVFER